MNKQSDDNVSTQSPVAVLGAGAWGAAIAVLLARNGQSVRLWDHDTNRLSLIQAERALMHVALPENLQIEMNFHQAIADVRDVCLVVPSHAFREVLVQLKAAAPANVRIFWGTKGLDPMHSSFLHETVCEIFSEDTPTAVLSGPSFAKEVMLNLPTAVSLAGNNEAFLDSLVHRLHSGHFRVYRNPDLIGVQLCGVIKNVMAIAVGISDGMGFGANTRCALITRGLAEMSRLCVVLGGMPETMLSLAGVGDLVLTCTDNQSRNRRFGLLIGQGHAAKKALQEIGESVEGYYNAKQLYQLAQKHQVSMPISEQVHAILYENRSPQAVLTELLEREPGSE